LGVVGVELFGKDAHPFESNPHFLQFDGLQYFLPFGQILLGSQPECQDGGVEGLQGHECVQVVLVDHCLYHVLVGVSAGFGQRNLDEVRGPFLS